MGGQRDYSPSLCRQSCHKPLTFGDSQRLSTNSDTDPLASQSVKKGVRDGEDKIRHELGVNLTDSASLDVAQIR